MSDLIKFYIFENDIKYSKDYWGLIFNWCNHEKFQLFQSRDKIWIAQFQLKKLELFSKMFAKNSSL